MYIPAITGDSVREICSRCFSALFSLDIFSVINVDQHESIRENQHTENVSYLGLEIVYLLDW